MPPIFKVIGAMLIWGSLGVFVRHIHLPSLETAFLRAVIAVVVLALVILGRRDKNKGQVKPNLLILLISGAAIGLNWVLLFQAYHYTTIANSTLSYYFAPVLVILLSPLVLKEKMSLRKVLAVLGGLLGLFLVLSQQTATSDVAYNHLIGIEYGLLAAVLYAGVVLLNKKLRDIDGFQMTLVQLLASALVLLPFVVARNNLHVPRGDIIFVLILGVVHTGLAYLLYFSGLKDMKAQNAALLSYLDPISAVLFGTLLLNEQLSPGQAIGGALILAAAFMGTKGEEAGEEAICKDVS